MSVDIRVPALGESIVEATISSWLKKEGDQVHKGEALVELETDKVNVEVQAEQDGILQQMVKQVGDTVSVGEVIGSIGASPAASSDGEQSEAGTEKSVADNGTSATGTPQPEVQEPSFDKQPTGAQPPVFTMAEAQRPPSPLARRIAAEYNVDIAQVQGTSPHGRITKEDVVNYLQQQQQSQKSPEQFSSQMSIPSASASTQPTQPLHPVSSPMKTMISPVTSADNRVERMKMSRRRQTIAQRLVEAQHTAAMLTTFNEIDMSAVMDVRSRRKDAFKERHQVSLGFMSFFTKAVIGALKAFPRLNAEIQGDELVLKHYYDIGIAVGAEEGLVVPVVREADRKSFAELEREIAALAKKARDNTLSLTDLQGGTFTITNGGVFGSLLSTPILNGPQVGILGMHKIEQRPVALNGQVVIRPMMYVALSYDHRIVDGREAVQFLVKVKELIEDPETLLLEG